jgi:hypothetical protein
MRSARSDSPGPAFKGTLRKIDGFLAARTNVFPVELVRKNFLFLSAIRAFADKGLQILQILHARTVHGGRHGLSPFVWAFFSEEIPFIVTAFLCQGFSRFARSAISVQQKELNNKPVGRELTAESSILKYSIS